MNLKIKAMIFDEFELNLPVDYHINSLIISQASDTAEKLTELECKLLKIECYIVEMEGETEVRTMTDEAQDIFIIYYDEQKTELYDLLNAQINYIQKSK